MKNNIKCLVGTLFVLFLGACISTGNPDEDVVITRIENVKPEVIAQIEANPGAENPPAVVVDVAEIGNEWALKAVEAFMSDATVVVFTERQYLKEEFHASQDLSQVINLTIPSVVNEKTGEVETDTEGVIMGVAGVVGSIFPPLQPFLPLLALIPWATKKRSRVHLKDAVGKAVPHDGTIDILGAIKSVSKAFGLDHTTDNPEELEKVAKKLRANKAAKNGGLEDMHATLDPETSDPKAEKATLVK